MKAGLGDQSSGPVSFSLPSLFKDTHAHPLPLPRTPSDPRGATRAVTVTTTAATVRAKAAGRRGQQCAVCNKGVHGLSKYCSRHHSASLRYGSPTQSRILKTDTAPYRKIVARLLDQNQQHPALVMVIGELEDMLTAAAAAVAAAGRPSTPKRADWRGKRTQELARIRTGGATGRDVFLTTAGLHFFARDRPTLLEPVSRAFHFAVARHALALRPRERYGGWTRRRGFIGWLDRKDTARLSTRVLSRLGHDIAVSLCAVLLALEPAYDQLVMAPQQRRQRLAAALAQPFN